MMQSPEEGPVQDRQRGEQGWQFFPSLKLPVAGHTVPVDVMAGGAMHSVRSFAFWVNPDLHVIQVPLPSAHWVQPRWHTIGTVNT